MVKRKRTGLLATTTIVAVRPAARTTQSTLIGTFVLLSPAISQQELLEALHHTRPVHRLHRGARAPAHGRQYLASLGERHGGADEAAGVARPCQHAGDTVLDVHLRGRVVV